MSPNRAWVRRAAGMALSAGLLAAPIHLGGLQPHATVRTMRGVTPGPSGQSMPIGNPAGWQRVFSDDFTGASLDGAKWFAYNGIPGGDPAGRFASSHVSVAGGELAIDAFKDPLFGNTWATGGVNNRHALSQTYGKYLVRYRMDRGPGVPYALLLWPQDDSWPPEVDFAEDNGADRSALKATVHSAAGSLERDLAGDFGRWHTVGVEWTPGRLVYTLDGKVWSEVTGSHVPSVPMSLALQTQTWACGHSWQRCPDSTTPSHVRLHVDWVVVYKPVS